MLLGSYSAKIDEKARLRLPAKFRREMPDTDDNTFYVTSDDGRCAQIYPLSIWERIAQKLQEPPRMDPAKLKLQRFTSYYGLLTQMDPQGRILIPQSLRDDAQISGDVIVVGKTDHLEVWNNEIFRKSLMESPLTLEEREKLAEQGF
jgi:MraZ protein